MHDRITFGRAAIGAVVGAAGLVLSAGAAAAQCQEWQPLGSGISGGTGTVHAMIEYQGHLYVGGNFQSVGGQSGTANLARWDGATWQQVPAAAGQPAIVGPTVYALAEYDGKLIVAGSLQSAGGLRNFIASWNPTQGHRKVGRDKTG